MITFRTSLNRYQLDFYGKKMLLSFCELLAFRNKIRRIDIESHFYNDHNGIEIISLCNLKQILILETRDVLELKDVMDTIFTPINEAIAY
ncbi:hypothetical protein [Flavicella sp.]|uniref:hypothetical protein n=1 Tax=Flavicella sp. TaxID=2957742 RepID=UPI003017EEEC